MREDMPGGPSIVFTRKAVVGGTKIRSSLNNCKSMVGIDASQLYPYALCQPMHTGLSLVENSMLIYIVSNRDPTARSFENMVMAFSRARVQNIKLKVFT